MAGSLPPEYEWLQKLSKRKRFKNFYVSVQANGEFVASYQEGVKTLAESAETLTLAMQKLSGTFKETKVVVDDLAALMESMEDDLSG